jgi:hypothetical protein
MFARSHGFELSIPAIDRLIAPVVEGTNTLHWGTVSPRLQRGLPRIGYACAKAGARRNISAIQGPKRSKADHHCYSFDGQMSGMTSRLFRR